MFPSEPELFAASTTVASPGGVLSVVKRRHPLAAPDAPDLEQRSRQRARQATIDEAGWLAAARHPSVVRLTRADPADFSLETAYAGRRTLQTAMMRPKDAIGALRGLAVTIDELHGRGLVHGQLRLDHLVLDGRDPIGLILCSPLGASSVAADDVAALIEVAGRMTERLVPRSSVWEGAADHLRSLDSPEIDDVIRALDDLRRPRLGRRRRLRRQVTGAV